MDPIESSPSLIDQIAEDFVAKVRRGQTPELQEYEAKYPEVAATLRDLLPALLVMEQLKPKANASGHQNRADAPLETIGKLGDYVIIRQVGQGGMGVVYEAIQQSLGRRVALKVLPRQPVVEERRRARFEREAKAAAALHHTNIVPVFAVGSESGLHYYAMQFIQGLGLDSVLVELRNLNRSPQRVPSTHSGSSAPTLQSGSSHAPLGFALSRSMLTDHFQNVRDDIRSEPDPATLPFDTERSRRSETDSKGASCPPLPGLSESPNGVRGIHYRHSVARIGVQVAEALHYAHEQGILHRDIKPSNLILDMRGTVWVADFGLAKADDQQDLTHSGDVLGTLRYMAPEAFTGQYDRGSDIYSLGLTVYELLALRPAFSESDRSRLVRMVLHESPPRLRTLDPGIPVDLETIVHKAIDRDPSQRYPTAQEFADDLHRFINDEPILARRTAMMKQLGRWCRKYPGVAILSLLMLAALCILGISQWQLVAERNRYRQSLSNALIAQSRFQRLTNEVGHRTESLANLARAAELGSSQLVREEAIRSLVLTDLREIVAHPVDFLSYAADSVAATPDGAAYVSYESGRVTIRSTLDTTSEGDEILWSANTNGEGPHTAKFSSCGSYLAVCFDAVDRGQSLWLWQWRGSPTDPPDVAHGERLAAEEPLRIVGGTIDRAFDIDSANGRLVVATRLNTEQPQWTLECIDIASGNRIWERPLPGQPFELRLDSTGERAAITVPDAESLLIVDAKTGQVEQKIDYAEDIYAIAWSPDSQAIAVGRGFDVAITYLDEPNNPRMLFDKGHTWMVHRLEFQPNGYLLASYSLREGVSRIWDLRRGSQALQVDGCVLGFTSDSKYAHVLRGKTLSVMEVQGDQPYGVLAATDGRPWEAWRVLSHPTEPVVLSCGIEGIEAWSVDSAKRLARTRDEEVHTMFFVPRSNELVTAGAGGTRQRRIHVDSSHDVRFETPSWYDFGPRTDEICSQPSSACCLSRDGTISAILLRHAAKVVVYDRQTGTYTDLRTSSHTSFLSLSPDGRWLVASNDEQPGFLGWDLKAGGLPIELEVLGSGAQPVFSPDGRYLVACTNDRYTLFDVGTWKTRHTWTNGQRVEGAAAFHPRGDVLALSMGRGCVRLVDPTSGTELLRLDGELDPVNILNLQFAADTRGERLYISSGRSGIRYWDLTQLDRTLSDLGL